MATYGPTNVLGFANNDADFRAWAQGIHDALVACGLVQTSDTGQINLSTVSRPGTNAYGGYEIFRFNDSLQATKPVFIKFEYGIGGVAGRPQWRITVSTATNGAGTPSGQVGTSFTSQSNVTDAASTVWPLYASGDGSRISVVANLDVSADSHTMCFNIERTCDDSGVPNGEGIYTQGYDRFNNANYTQTIPFTGSIPSRITGASGGWNPGAFGATSKVGTEVALSQQATWNGKPCPLRSFLTYVHADIGELSSFTATVNGATHTYMPMGDGIPVGFSSPTNTPSPSVAMLWE